MQEKTVWFGTEDDLVQVKCPSTELTRTRVAWRNSGTYLNGGGFAISSGTGHDEAAISWGADSVEGFSTLLTQLNKGEPLYYLDPLACKTNILPPYAAQYQPNNPFGFVAESATGANGYPSTAMKNLYTDRQIATVPVPEGYNLWVGCKGSSGGVSVDAPVQGGDDPEIPAEQPNSSQRLTHHYPGGRSYSVFVRGGSVLQGVMAQILPNGVEPSTGGFIPGMGFSALALQDNPQITEYSAVLENYQMAMTANFIEVGSWM